MNGITLRVNYVIGTLMYAVCMQRMPIMRKDQKRLYEMQIRMCAIDVPLLFQLQQVAVKLKYIMLCHSINRGKENECNEKG